MDSTTLVTFLLETSRRISMVELFGSWDNFSNAYAMTRDTRRGHGIWSGCHRFKGIVCDGDLSMIGGRRDGALKMGGTYWFYYRLNGDLDHTDPALPTITSCPLLPGQPVNVLEVPQRSFSNTPVDPYFAVTTLNPEDKFKKQRAIPSKDGESPYDAPEMTCSPPVKPRASSVDRAPSPPFDAAEAPRLRRRSKTFQSSLAATYAKRLPALPVDYAAGKGSGAGVVTQDEQRGRSRSPCTALRSPVLTTDMLPPVTTDMPENIDRSHRLPSPAGTMVSILDETCTNDIMYHQPISAVEYSEPLTSWEQLIEFTPSDSSAIIRTGGRPQSRRGSPVKDRQPEFGPNSDLPWLAPLPESIADDPFDFHLDYSASPSMSDNDGKSHSYPSLWSTASDFSSQPSEADEANSPNDSGWNSPHCLLGENELSSTTYFESTVDSDLTASFEMLDTSTYDQDSLPLSLHHMADQHSKQPGAHDGFTGYSLPRHLVASDVTITRVHPMVPSIPTMDRRTPKTALKDPEHTVESTIFNILDDFAYLGKALS